MPIYDINFNLFLERIPFLSVHWWIQWANFWCAMKNQGYQNRPMEKTIEKD